MKKEVSTGIILQWRAGQYRLCSIVSSYIVEIDNK